MSLCVDASRKFCQPGSICQVGEIVHLIFERECSFKLGFRCLSEFSLIFPLSINERNHESTAESANLAEWSCKILSCASSRPFTSFGKLISLFSLKQIVRSAWYYLTRSIHKYRTCSQLCRHTNSRMLRNPPGAELLAFNKLTRVNLSWFIFSRNWENPWQRNIKRNASKIIII